MTTGIYPFWFWNDRLSADEIRWQVGEMADKGIRGFFIHPRQGLGQPYLSEAFFKMVDVAVEAAEEHGLLVHLYDEYPYPSGVAGGEVVLGNPQYHATGLVQKTYEVAGGSVSLELPRGKILCAMAYAVEGGKTNWTRGIDVRKHIGMVLVSDSYTETGLTAYNQKRYWANQPTPILEVALPEEPHRVFASSQVTVAGHKYWGHYVDVLNEQAMRRFLDLTHERYRKRYGDKFGKSIISIFVDETFPHWSDRIPTAFADKYGYDLCQYLPALQDPSHPDHVKATRDLHRLKYDLFCESFERPLSEWCAAHNLAYSGEKDSMRLAQLRYMDIPGCEPGHTKAGAKMDLLRPRIRQNARATASAAYFYGKSGALCECYHSLGWSGTLQDAKLIADGLLLMGIRFLVPHGFFYSTHALKKHDAPPTFFFQMPYWPLFGELSKRVDRIGRLFEGTHIDAKILLVEPSSGVPTKEDLDAYVGIHELLVENHLDYLVVDTDILQQARIEEGRVHARDIVAELIIVPPMQVVEDPLREWLEEYRNAGGAVFHCQSQFDAESLRRRILGIVKPSLSVQCDREEVSSVLVVKRVSEDRTLWFVLNTGAESLSLEISSGGGLREIPLEDGIPPCLGKQDGAYQRAVAPFESFMLEAREPQEPRELTPRSRVRVRGPAKIRVHSKNLLRMYEWRMSLLSEDGSPLHTATVPAIPLINQLDKGRFRFAPTIRVLTGGPPELTLPELRVRYEYNFQNAYSGPVALVMEPGSVVGDWRFVVNDSAPRGPDAFAPTVGRTFLSGGRQECLPHVRGSLGTDITDLLRQGWNTIRFEVVAARPDSGLLNALYLAGDFGVALDPVRLVEPVSIGAFEKYRENLLPYYAGIIEYVTEFDLDDVPQTGSVIVELDYDEPFHEATEVSVNGCGFQPVLWQPRCLTVRADQLRPGRNTMTTRVFTTLVRSFEGKWFDHARHEYRDAGEA